MGSQKDKIRKRVPFEKKIRRSILFMILIIMFAIVANVLFMFYKIAVSLEESNKETGTAVAQISSQTNDAEISDKLYRLTQEKAKEANKGFLTLFNTVSVMKENAELLYANADDYGSVKVYPPQKKNADVLSVQVTYASNVNTADASIKEEQGLIGNLGALLYSINDNNPSITSCYYATESGIMLQADTAAAYQFDENGNIKSFDAKKRPWYKGAVKKQDIYFTDVMRDADTGKFAVVCSAPIYKNDKIVAVAGAGMLFTDFESILEDSKISKLGASYIIDKKGNLIASTDENYVWESDGEELINLLDDKNELSDKMSDFLDNGTSDISIITLKGERYYISCSPLDTVGWGFVSLLPESEVNATTVKLVQKLEEKNEDANNTMMTTLNLAVAAWVATIAVLFVIIAFYIRRLTARLLRPIKALTRKVSTVDGDNLIFKWENRAGDEIDTLGLTFSRLTERIQAYINDITVITAEKERIGAELSVATQIQADMLPSIFPAFPERSEFDLYASMEPAKEVGGDFYDFFLVDDNHLALVMADVSGKGVPAALFMVIAKTLIKNRAQMGGGPAEIIKHVNNQLCAGNQAGLFVTVWLAILDINTGKGLAINAGHEHPVLMRRDGKFELVVYRHSPAIAIMEDIPYREHEFELHPGDRLFVYTDGVAEATNTENKLFDTERLLDVLNENRDSSPKELLAAVKGGIDSFVDGAEQFDDITMLCLDYFGPKNEDSFKEFSIEAKEENLDELLDFIDGNLEEMDCPMKIQTLINVCVEELFVNISKYAYAPNIGTATVRIENLKDPNRVSITFIDSGVPYNPLEKLDPDVTLTLEERPVGGLGIFMVKKRMDDVRYEYKDNHNILTITKIF